eukprot:2005788-Rhodomonas_salina.1
MLQRFESGAGDWKGYFPLDAAEHRLCPVQAAATHGTQMETLRKRYRTHLQKETNTIMRKHTTQNVPSVVNFSRRDRTLQGLERGVKVVFMLLCRPSAFSCE